MTDFLVLAFTPAPIKSCYLENTTDMAQVLRSPGSKECSTVLPKFITFGSFIWIMGTSAIMDQTTCYYYVTTS